MRTWNFCNILFCTIFLLPSLVACQQYVVPTAIVTAYSPKGFRITIPHEEGISSVAFHVNINENFTDLLTDGHKYIAKHQNGKWIVDNKTTKLKIGDVVYYWIYVVNDDLEYDLYDQEFEVTELVQRENTVVGVQCAFKSVTKIIDKDGNPVKSTCPNQLLFEDNFDTLDKAKWTVQEHFSVEPNYEFVVYNKNNVKVEGGHLKITPKSLAKKYGNDFIRKGNMTLAKCTKQVGTKDCHREAFGAYILPPVSSGKMTTAKSFRFLYGRVEIRAKLSKGDWIYPLLSLEPLKANVTEERINSMRVASSAGNPSLITVDELEMGGSLLRGGAIVQSTERPEIKYRPESGSSNDRLWSSDFHVYELIWKPDLLKLKVDGKTYATSGDSRLLKKHIHNPMFINLAVAVGGYREFPDNSISGSYKKPWRNQGSKALFDFFNASDKWLPTWQERSSTLQVDYVKVYAI